MEGDQTLIQRANSTSNGICSTIFHHEPDTDTAHRALEALAKELDRDHSGATTSLRKGIADT